MKRLLAGLVVAVLTAGGTPIATLAQEEAAEVEAAELLADPAAWNGRRVIVIGELVGDYSPREDGVWVQVNDDPFVDSPVGAGGRPEGTNLGIGARIPSDLFQDVEGSPGRYGRRGPVVRLEGIFLHSDPDKQGETYLAVDTAQTLRPSREYPLPGADVWLLVGAVLLAIAGVVMWAGRRRPSLGH